MREGKKKRKKPIPSARGNKKKRGNERSESAHPTLISLEARGKMCSESAMATLRGTGSNNERGHAEANAKNTRRTFLPPLMGRESARTDPSPGATRSRTRRTRSGTRKSRSCQRLAASFCVSVACALRCVCAALPLAGAVLAVRGARRLGRDEIGSVCDLHHGARQGS